MSLLTDLHISNNPDAASVVCFENLIVGETFQTLRYSSPQDYVKQYWDAYTAAGNNMAVLNGKVFELIIETLFFREGIVPFYTQVQVQYVPNVDFDIVMCKENTMVAISLKVSLRERYKQADLEAFALKNVHRNSKCYLFTLNEDEAKNVQRKIETCDMLGLDEVVYCLSDRFDEVIEEIKSDTYRRSINKPEIKSGYVIG